jgi:uncharacterized membrane protein
MDLYPWLRYIHVAGALLFVLGHGASVAVAFKVRNERDPQRIDALLQLSSSAISLFYVGILLLLGAGIWAGFTPGIPGSWWEDRWIWVALITFVLTMIAMYAVATNYYKRVRTIVEAMVGGSEVVSEDRLAEVLRGPRPWILAAIGFGSILFILYLMLFKPY